MSRPFSYFTICSMLVLICLPPFASAETLSAGFAPHSIWLSRTHVIAGDSVNIVTVLFDSSDSPLSGDVVFLVDGKAVGTKSFSLKAGETAIQSLPWIATAGEHSISARIEKISGATTTGMAFSNHTSDTVAIAVAESPPPPPPSPTEAALASLTSGVQSGIASSTPVVTDLAHRAYNSLEYLRENAIHTLEQQLTSSASKNAGTLSPDKQVLGTSTKSASFVGDEEPQQANSFFTGLWRNMLSGLLFICRLQVLFYALLLFALFMLYQLLRTYLRERR